MLTIVVVAASCASPPIVNIEAYLGLDCERLDGYVIAMGATDAEASANYARGKLTTRGALANRGSCAILEDNVERDPNAHAVLVVVSAFDTDGTSADPATCGANGFRNCLVMRSAFASSVNGVTVSMNSDVRCLGLDCGQGSTCTRGVCVSDVAACTNGGPDGTPPDCCPSTSILVPPQPYFDDPCPDAGADPNADAACGIGFCTASADAAVGLGSCVCGGGELNVGVGCVVTGAGPPANIGGIFGRRCLCDLDATPGHPSYTCGRW